MVGEEDVELKHASENIWYALATIAANSVVASFSNAHSFLGLNRGPLKKVYETYGAEGWFNTLWTLQALSGIVFLFFLLLTIRNKFKMG